MRYSDDDAFDENGVLKDGRSVRVSLHDAAMSRSGTQRQQTSTNRITDGRSPNDPTALHRPGFRVNTGDSDSSSRQKIRDEYEKADIQARNRWKVGDLQTQCSECFGEGVDEDGDECPTCNGEGVMPDVEDKRERSGKSNFGSGNGTGRSDDDPDPASDRRTVDQRMKDHRERTARLIALRDAEDAAAWCKQ